MLRVTWYLSTNVGNTKSPFPKIIPHRGGYLIRDSGRSASQIRVRGGDCVQRARGPQFDRAGAQSEAH